MSINELQARRLGAVIREARLNSGMSIRTLATRVGVHSSYIGYLEQGRYAQPSSDRLTRLCEVLDIEPARLAQTTGCNIGNALPEMRTYFRAKYDDLVAADIERIERYVQRLRRESK